MDRYQPLARLKRSFLASAANVVFGMEDGTVSIFGLVFGVSATTSDGASILVAGASGAAAAAVSMMAGVYLEAETIRDSVARRRARPRAETSDLPSAMAVLLPGKLRAAGLDPVASAALIRVTQHDDAAIIALASLMRIPRAESGQNPLEQSLWMLVADFLSAAVPIMPFALVPVAEARYISAAVTLALLVALGAGRASVAGRGIVRTIAETVSIGLLAAFAGVGIGLIVSHIFSHS